MFCEFWKQFDLVMLFRINMNSHFLFQSWNHVWNNRARTRMGFCVCGKKAGPVRGAGLKSISLLDLTVNGLNETHYRHALVCRSGFVPNVKHSLNKSNALSFEVLCIALKWNQYGFFVHLCYVCGYLTVTPLFLGLKKLMAQTWKHKIIECHCMLHRFLLLELRGLNMFDNIHVHKACSQTKLYEDMTCRNWSEQCVSFPEPLPQPHRTPLGLSDT